MKKKILILCGVLLIIVILLISIITLSIKEDKYIVITFNKLDNFPEPFFICKGENVHLIILNNDTYMMAFDNETVFISYSMNGINWTTPISLTNESGHPIEWALGPFIHEFDNGTIIITYNKGGPDNNYYAIISKDGKNWSNNFITPVTFYDDEPWNEIKPPKFMEEPIEAFSSLLKLKNRSYLISRGENFSPTDEIYTDLIITYSENGKDWSLPIRITNHTGGFAPSMIQKENGEFFIIYEGREGLYSLSFTYDDLLNVSGPYEVIERPNTVNYTSSFELLLLIIALGITLIFFKKYSKSVSSML